VPVRLAERTIFQLWLPAGSCGAFAPGTVSALFDVAALVCAKTSAPVTVVAAAAPVAGPATAATGQPLTLPLHLPIDSTPRMEYRTDRVVYDYGTGSVQVLFLPDGSAYVVYEDGLLRAP